MLRVTALILTVAFLSGCGQQFVGAAYKMEFGRQVTQWFDDEAATTWRVGAEFRFDAKK